MESPTAIQDLFDRVARGEYVPPLTPAASASLLSRARRALDEGPEAAEAALRVAAFVGGYQGASLLREVVRKGRGKVAVQALEQATRCHPDGALVLREGLEHRERDVVVSALQLLTRHAEPSGTGRARQLLRSPDAAIRSATADYLGMVAGPAVIPSLQPLLSDSACAPAARLALDRLERRVSRPPAEPWQRAALAPGALEIPPVERPPGELSARADDLLRHLARADERDQERLLTALEAAPAPDVAALIRPMSFGTAADLAVGACRLCRFRGDRRWLAAMRKLLGHPVAWVRLEAARAVGAVGAMVDLAPLDTLAADPIPEVAEAAREARSRIEAGETVQGTAGLLPDATGTPATEAPVAPPATDEPQAS